QPPRVPAHDPYLEAVPIVRLASGMATFATEGGSTGEVATMSTPEGALRGEVWQLLTLHERVYALGSFGLAWTPLDAATSIGSLEWTLQPLPLTNPSLLVPRDDALLCVLGDTSGCIDPRRPLP